MANHFSIVTMKKPWTICKVKNIWHQKWTPWSEDVQYTTSEKWRTIMKSSRKNQAAGPKQKWCSVVDVFGGKSKVWGCKEQYCIRTWNVRSCELDNGKFNSVQFSSVMSESLPPSGLQHARPPCPSSTPGVYSNSCPLSQWCHPTISSSVVPFSPHLQSFPASGYFPMSQLFASGGQSIGVSTSTSVLPVNTQDWSPLGWTGWISLLSKELSRVFSNTTVQKHQFFSTQLSL